MDILPERFRSLKAPGESGEIVIDKSRFYGYAKRADTEQEALSFIDEVKALHPGHSCTCYAYVCGFQGNLQRFHDGHEPVGGMPILECIRQNGATNAVCAVVRYFGGVKLGKGGLARAFAAAAKGAVEAAQVCDYLLTKSISVSFDYTHSGKLLRYLEESGFIRQDTHYTEQVTVDILVKSTDAAKLADEVSDMTAGKARLEELAEIYYPWIL